MNSSRFNNEPPTGTRPIQNIADSYRAADGVQQPDTASDELEMRAADEEARTNSAAAPENSEKGPKQKSGVTLSKETLFENKDTNAASAQAPKQYTVNLSKERPADTAEHNAPASAGEPAAQDAGSNPQPRPQHAASAASPDTGGSGAPGAPAQQKKKAKPWVWIGSGAAAVIVGIAAITGTSVGSPAGQQTAAHEVAASATASVAAVTEAASAVPLAATSENSPLELNTEDTIMGMTYRRNNDWVNEMDPLEAATDRLYTLNVGDNGELFLCLSAYTGDQAEELSGYLASASEQERDELLNAMFDSASDSPGQTSTERAPVPPAGTYAMWSYASDTDMPDGNPGKMRGYTIVGADTVYTLFEAAGNDAILDSFEPTWRQIANSLQFSGTIPEPASSPATTESPTPAPSPSAAAYPGGFDSNGFVFADSSERYLTDDDLAGLSAEMLGFARNEIFARNGNLFRKDKYINHYGAYDWYRNIPNKRYDIAPEELTPIERANIALIQQYEAMAA